jgi:subtilisin-like proprotein convertase family protein
MAPMNMKMTLILAGLLAVIPARAGVLLSQTFSPAVVIPEGNPVGVEASGTYTMGSGANGLVVGGITVGLNVSGGYNGDLVAYLVAPNGTMVTLMSQPGMGVDGFGAASSGMNLTLDDTAGSSIQSVTGGYGTSLTGTYQADGTLGTFDGSSANGTWDIYFADVDSGGGSPTLNSFTLNIELVPEPVKTSLWIFWALLLAGAGWKWLWKLRRKMKTAV